MSSSRMRADNLCCKRAPSSSPILWKSRDDDEDNEDEDESAADSSASSLEAQEWSPKENQEQQQSAAMASRSCLYALVAFLAIFALSGTILQNSLTWKQHDLKSPSFGTDGAEIESVKRPSQTWNASMRIADDQAEVSISQSCQVEGNEHVLRVYMYDLPAEFHFGMLDRAPGKQESSIWPSNLTDIPRYPGGLYQQHSPEYWLTVDLLSSAAPSMIRKSPCTAVRVFDSDAADIFFVPFFSSLSYNRHCRQGQRTSSCIEDNDQLENRLVDFLAKQDAWKKNGGVDHVIVMHHPNSLRVARSLLKDAMFIVADFGRYSHAVANMRKDLVAPYKHVIPTFVNDSSTYTTRKTLLYFQGAIVRKEGGVIRQQLYEVLRGNRDVHFTTGNTQRDGIRSATFGMRSSKFCLHMAGDTPSSNRLFDAIASHCIPVIISDDIELPFEDELDYSDFCVFIESDKALRKGYVVNLLRGMSSQEWTRRWEKLKQVERHFEYQHPSLPDDAVHMTWKAIARRLPALKFVRHKRHRYEPVQYGITV